MKRFAACMAVVLAGCNTPLPFCPQPDIGVIETDRGNYYVFDEENFAREIARLEGLSNGTCRSGKPGA